MKTYKVEFERNGYHGAFGVSHTWVDATSEEDAMSTVENLRPGVYALAATERVIDSCSCSRGGSAIFCECRQNSEKIAPQTARVDAY